MLPHVLVSDIGAEFTKMGHAGDDAPSLVVPSDEAAFLDRIAVLSAERVHAIVSGKRVDRASLLETLFEHRVAESLVFVDSAVLSLFSYNRANGVVIDYGGETTVTSVVDGRVERCVTREGGVALSAAVRHAFGVEDVHAFKEQIEIGGRSALFANKEFDTSRINARAEEILVVDAIVRDVVETSDSKGVLSTNIYMAGAASRTKGLCSRMKEELKMFRNKVVYEDKFHAFLGGSVLGAITQSRQLFITQKDYAEHGESILLRKSLD